MYFILCKHVILTVNNRANLLVRKHGLSWMYEGFLYLPKT